MQPLDAGMCDRGQLVPRLGKPLLTLGSSHWYRHHFQAFGSGVEIAKVPLLARMVQLSGLHVHLDRQRCTP